MEKEDTITITMNVIKAIDSYFKVRDNSTYDEYLQNKNHLDMLFSPLIIDKFKILNIYPNLKFNRDYRLISYAIDELILLYKNKCFTLTKYDKDTYNTYSYNFLKKIYGKYNDNFEDNLNDDTYYPLLYSIEGDENTFEEAFKEYLLYKSIKMDSIYRTKNISYIENLFINLDINYCYEYAPLKCIKYYKLFYYLISNKSIC